MESYLSERWVAVTDYPMYEVSSEGRLRSWWPHPGTKSPRTEPRICVGGVDPDGYRKALLKANDGTKRHHKIASLVAAAFHGPRPVGTVVAHDNGILTDDRAANLIYKTQLENIADKFRHGTMPLGEVHYGHKLTEANVREIRSQPANDPAFAHKFGVSQATVYCARTGRTWKWLDRQASQAA